MHIIMKRLIVILTLSFISLTSLCQSTTNSISDGARRIYYSDIVDAETKIIEYYEERLKKYPDGDDEDFNSALPYKMFTELILHDPRAFNYSFERFLDASENDKRTIRALRIIESPDQKVRLYTWDEHGGTMTNYSGITSIKTGESVFSYATQKDEFGENTIDSFTDIASGAYKIDQFIDNFYDTVYVIYSHSSGSSRMQLQYASLYKIQNNRVVGASLFQTEEGMTNSICLYYEPSFSFYSGIEYKDGEFLLPETRMNDLNPYAGDLFTGRCISYKWENGFFKNKGIVYSQNEGLYSKLLNYQFNIIQINFEKWVIRIDKMPNGSHRYASWKKPKSTTDEPDLVINSGYEDIEVDTSDEYKKKFKYIFQNNEYFYIVSWLSDYGNLGKGELVVKKNDKVLMKISDEK